MPELTLQRTARGQYTLGDIGTLRELRMFAAEITADGRAWTLRRALFGFGQIVRAKDSAGGARAADYVPNGFLHLRGIYAGTIRHGDRALLWRANHQLGREWTLTEHDAKLAHFTAGSQAQPAHVSVEHPADIGSLLLLFCCHLVKQAADTAKAGAVASAGVASGR